MSNSIYFSAQLTPQGEVKLIKHDGPVSSNPAPQVVTVFVDGKRAYVPNDPTLAVYHQPECEHEPLTPVQLLMIRARECIRKSKEILRETSDLIDIHAEIVEDEE